MKNREVFFMCIATEIVTLKTIQGITQNQFISIVDALERDFHSKQPGFIDTELLYNDKSDEWIMIQHWDSLDSMKSASPKMFNNPDTEAFVKSLNNKNVKMLMLPQLGRWSR